MQIQLFSEVVSCKFNFKNLVFPLLVHVLNFSCFNFNLEMFAVLARVSHGISVVMSFTFIGLGYLLLVYYIFSCYDELIFRMSFFRMARLLFVVMFLFSC